MEINNIESQENLENQETVGQLQESEYNQEQQQQPNIPLLQFGQPKVEQKVNSKENSVQQRRQFKRKTTCKHSLCNTVIQNNSDDDINESKKDTSNFRDMVQNQNEKQLKISEFNLENLIEKSPKKRKFIKANNECHACLNPHNMSYEVLQSISSQLQTGQSRKERQDIYQEKKKKEKVVVEQISNKPVIQSDKMNLIDEKMQIRLKNEVKKVNKEFAKDEEEKNKKQQYLFSLKNLDLNYKDIGKLAALILVKNVKIDSEVEFLLKIVRQLKIFQDNPKLLGTIPKPLIQKSFQLQFYPKHEVIFNKGDIGYNFYIVLSGSVLTLIPNKKPETNQNNQQDQKGSNTGRKGKKRVSVKFENKHNKSSSNNDQEGNFTNRQKSYTSRKNNSQKNLDGNLDSNKDFSQDQKDQENKYAQQSQLNSSKFGDFTDRDQENSQFKDENENNQDFSQEEVEDDEDFINQQNWNLDQQAEYLLQRQFPDWINVKTYKEGEGFGDFALLSKQACARTATMVTREDTFCMSISKQAFDKMLENYKEKIVMKLLTFLRSYQFFRQIPENYLLQLIKSNEIEQIHFDNVSQTPVLYKENDYVSKIYFIKSGQVELSRYIDHSYKQISSNNNKDEQALEDQINYLKVQKLAKKQGTYNEFLKLQKMKLKVVGPGQFFGEEEIIKEQRLRQFTAQIISYEAEIYTYDAKSFMQLMKENKKMHMIFEEVMEQNKQIGQEFKKKVDTTVKVTNENREKAMELEHSKFLLQKSQTKNQPSLQFISPTKKKSDIFSEMNFVSPLKKTYNQPSLNLDKIQNRESLSYLQSPYRYSVNKGRRITGANKNDLSLINKSSNIDNNNKIISPYPDKYSNKQQQQQQYFHFNTQESSENIVSPIGLKKCQSDNNVPVIPMLSNNELDSFNEETFYEDGIDEGIDARSRYKQLQFQGKSPMSKSPVVSSKLHQKTKKYKYDQENNLQVQGGEFQDMEYYMSSKIEKQQQTLNYMNMEGVNYTYDKLKDKKIYHINGNLEDQLHNKDTLFNYCMKSQKVLYTQFKHSQSPRQQKKQQLSQSEVSHCQQIMKRIEKQNKKSENIHKNFVDIPSQEVKLVNKVVKLKEKDNQKQLLFCDSIQQQDNNDNNDNQNNNKKNQQNNNNSNNKKQISQIQYSIGLPANHEMLKSPYNNQQKMQIKQQQQQQQGSFIDKKNQFKISNKKSLKQNQSQNDIKKDEFNLKLDLQKTKTNQTQQPSLAQSSQRDLLNNISKNNNQNITSTNIQSGVGKFASTVQNWENNVNNINNNNLKTEKEKQIQFQQKQINYIKKQQISVKNQEISKNQNQNQKIGNLTFYKQKKEDNISNNFQQKQKELQKITQKIKKMQQQEKIKESKMEDEQKLKEIMLSPAIKDADKRLSKSVNYTQNKNRLTGVNFYKNQHQSTRFLIQKQQQQNQDKQKNKFIIQSNINNNNNVNNSNNNIINNSNNNINNSNSNSNNSNNNINNSNNNINNSNNIINNSNSNNSQVFENILESKSLDNSPSKYQQKYNQEDGIIQENLSGEYKGPQRVEKRKSSSSQINKEYFQQGNLSNSNYQTENNFYKGLKKQKYLFGFMNTEEDEYNSSPNNNTKMQFYKSESGYSYNHHRKLSQENKSAVLFGQQGMDLQIEGCNIKSNKTVNKIMKNQESLPNINNNTSNKFYIQGGQLYKLK